MRFTTHQPWVAGEGFTLCLETTYLARQTRQTWASQGNMKTKLKCKSIVCFRRKFCISCMCIAYGCRIHTCDHSVHHGGPP